MSWVGWAAGTLLVALSAGSLIARGAQPNESADIGTGGSPQVEFTVSSSAGTAQAITYTDSGSPSSVSDVPLPWRITVAETGYIVLIADVVDPGGWVSCTISVRGVPIAHQTARGDSPRATCTATAS